MTNIGSRYYKNRVSVTIADAVVTLPNLAQIILTNDGNEDLQIEFDGDVVAGSAYLRVGASVQLNALGAATVHHKGVGNTTLQILGVRTVKA